MKKIIPVAFTLLSILSYQACIKSNVFEKNTTIKYNKWQKDNKLNFEFDITDTTSDYLMFLTIRHSDAYPFSNIWLNVKTTLPIEQKTIETRTEVPLAEADGKWMGRNFKDIIEQQMPLTGSGVAHFNRTGKYKIQLEQIMRENPLPEIMSVGVRLEKITK
jgi:gliding motility-associated lipoprotein GldH